MDYKHIKDCWAAIENAKSLKEIKKLFRGFPRWSGDWGLDIDPSNDIVLVINNWYDENLDEENEDIGEYDGFKFSDFDVFKKDLITDQKTIYK